MTFKIQAAARLSATKADDAKAMAYVKSLGLTPTRVELSDHGVITVAIKGAKNAVAILTKKFGKPHSTGKVGKGLTTQRFDINKTRSIDLVLKNGGSTGSVSLVDDKAADSKSNAT